MAMDGWHCPEAACRLAPCIAKGTTGIAKALCPWLRHSTAWRSHSSMCANVPGRSPPLLSPAQGGGGQWLVLQVAVQVYGCWQGSAPGAQNQLQAPSRQLEQQQHMARQAGSRGLALPQGLSPHTAWGGRVSQEHLCMLCILSPGPAVLSSIPIIAAAWALPHPSHAPAGGREQAHMLIHYWLNSRAPAERLPFNPMADAY